MLNGRFGSLRELRLVISDEKSAGYFCAWIAGCVVIHNILIALRLAEDMGFDEIQLESEDNGPSAAAERSADQDSARSQRRNDLFQHFEYEKGYST